MDALGDVMRGGAPAAGVDADRGGDFAAGDADQAAKGWVGEGGGGAFSISFPNAKWMAMR